VRDGAAIAAALGGSHYGKGWSFRCPCHDDRVASASIRNDGLVTWFAGCPRSEVLAALDALGFTDDYDGPITRQEDATDVSNIMRQAGDDKVRIVGWCRRLQ
jgi:hypothetical protein